MKKPDLICFDFDGTLCNTLPDIAVSMNTILQRYRYPEVPENKVRDFIGNGIVKLVERSLRHAVSQGGGSAITPELLSTIAREMGEYYSEHLTDRSYLYPGAKELLYGLDGISVVVVSNKPEAMVRAMLKHYGIDTPVDFVVGGDTLNVAKPDIAVWYHVLKIMGLQEPLNGWMVGDSLPDVLFGRAAGLTTIVVSYGYNDVTLLKEAGAGIVIDNLMQLRNMLADEKTDR